MEPFASLDPEVRSYALVGFYLSGWGAMESALNRCIEKALRLDAIQGVVVARNTQLRSKINILRTLINAADMKDEDRKTYDKMVLSIGTMSNDRNMVAHDWFEPDENGDGVHFFAAKATGKLHFPEARWSIEEVFAKHGELFDVVGMLHNLAPLFSRADLARALVQRNRLLTEPMEVETWLNLELRGALHAPSEQDSPPQVTTESKSPETRQSRTQEESE